MPEKPVSAADFSGQSAAELRSVIAGLQAQLQQRDIRIELLEEMLRLQRIRKFAASSEKSVGQADLFDEAETQAEMDALAEQLPDADVPEAARPRRKRRQRRLPDTLPRERIELTLSDEDKVVTAPRPVHPLGKCQATPSLLAHLVTGKYADGLPLYRQEKMFKRLGHELDRSTMAHWIVRLEPVLNPLIEQIRESQIGSSYLQADETRIQVLKENGKTAQSDKWMWVMVEGRLGSTVYGLLLFCKHKF